MINEVINQGNNAIKMLKMEDMSLASAADLEIFVKFFAERNLTN